MVITAIVSLLSRDPKMCFAVEPDVSRAISSIQRAALHKRFRKLLGSPK
jgi:hypothetical protein